MRRGYQTCSKATCSVSENNESVTTTSNEYLLTEMSSFVGQLIARYLKSHETIFNTLIPVAEQRCLEKDLKNLGQPVPNHVRILNIHPY